MQRPPPMWRTELWHPVVVHFGVALLIVGTVIYVAHLAFWRRPKLREKLAFAGRIVLVGGVLSAWISIITGNMADGVVGREICDPLVLEEHSYYAYAVGYLFTFGVLSDLACSVLRTSRLKLQFWLRTGISTVFLTGSVLTAYVGHLGAKLVYQQAAAVYQPSEDCEEFRTAD